MKNLIFYKKIFQNIDIIYEDLNLIALNKKKKRFPRLDHFFSILRKCTNGQKNNLKNNSTIINFEKIGNDLGKKKFVIYILSIILRKYKTFRKLFLIINNLFNSYFLDDKHIRNYFQKYSPTHLITTSFGYDYDHYFANIAKKFNCKTTSIIYSWDNPSSKGYKLSNSDHYIVWNNTMKKELEIFQDIESDKIEICGVAHWDVYFKNIKKKDEIKKNFYTQNKLQNDKKIILYFSSSPRDFSNAYEKIDEICNIIKKKSNLILIARMHPLYLDEKICQKYLGDTNKTFEKKLLNKYPHSLMFKNPNIEFFGENHNDVFYPLKDIDDLKNLYLSSEILLTEYSTTMLEGCIFNLPVINVAIGQFRNTGKPIKYISEYHHLHNLKKYNAFYEVENTSELQKNILELINGIDGLKRNREKLFQGELNFFSGSSQNKTLEQVIKNIN